MERTDNPNFHNPEYIEAFRRVREIDEFDAAKEKPVEFRDNTFCQHKHDILNPLDREEFNRFTESLRRWTE